MKLESQLTNREISQKLEKLGVPQDSLYYWVWCLVGEEHTKIVKKSFVNDKWDSCSAYTVAELGNILPWDILKIKGGKYLTDLSVNMGHDWWSRLNACSDSENNIYNHKEVAKTEANARGLMLEYLIKNKLIRL